MRAPAPVGVLLVNLGTPDEPTVPAIRRYLREFLRDPCIVDTPPLLWWPILHLLILPRRPRQLVERYQSIWTPEGSPLLVASRAQERGLQDLLGEGFAVRLGMRIGEPSIASALEEFRRRGCRRVVLFPLYPQYCRATCGSVDRHLEILLRRRPVPFEIVRVPPFFEEEGYLSCVAARIRERAGERGFDHLVFSFHGLPERHVAAGDPYPRHCERSAEGIARALSLESTRWSIAYQSRFGRERWLRPSTAEVLASLAPHQPRVLVVCPGFVADCLETRYEIEVELARDFRGAGGEKLLVAPALNGAEEWIEVMAREVRRALGTRDRE
jgi:protoporphyrin/coproporphyrin ferrochelatase